MTFNSYASPTKKSFDLQAAREKHKTTFTSIFHQSEANRFKSNQRNSYDTAQVGAYRKQMHEFNKSQEHLSSHIKKSMDSVGLGIPNFMANNSGTLKFDAVTGG